MEKQEHRVLNAKYLVSSLIIFGLVILCSVFGLIFLADNIPIAVRIIMGIVLSALTMCAVFIYGRSQGEGDYKKQILKETGRSNSFTSIKFDIISCILKFAVFAFLFLVLLIIGAAFKIIPLIGVVTITFLPFALIFSLAIVAESMSLIVLAVYIPYILLICGSFTAGYIIKINQIKKVRRDIASELRMFNN